MRLSQFLIVMLLICLLTPTMLCTRYSSGDGLHVSIHVHSPIPGNRSYRGCNVSINLIVYNGFKESVSISIDPDLPPMELVWSNYTQATLNPGTNIVFTWVLCVPESLGFGNYSLGFNIAYTLNSNVYNMYKEAWIQVIPRNISLITADLYRNATRYYLVVSNPLIDPGQYIIENVSVTIRTFNVTVEPREAFIGSLYGNSSYTIPLTIRFRESDIGVLLVNITAQDDVHGLVYFNYTFIILNATAHLDLLVINDYGEPLPGAVVKIANGTYTTDSNGLVSLDLPIGIYNYSIVYDEHVMSGKLVLYTGYNRYTIVVDLTPPVITSVKQKGYGVVVVAYDPGVNCSGVSSIIFIQGEKSWKYVFHAQRNISLMFYPPIKSGNATVIIADAQGNNRSIIIQYIEPERTGVLWELVIICSTVFIVLTALLLLTLYK